MHIIKPHMSCVVNMPLNADDSDDLAQAMAQGFSEIYVISAAGIIKHHRLRGENRYIRVKVDSIPNYKPPVLEQTVNFLPGGQKIPREIFDQILAFFRKVVKVNGDQQLEAMAHVLWNKEKGYYIGVPPQRVGGATASYDWSYIPSDSMIILDVHSHGISMGAFFSGTDNNDDSANVCFSGVFGKIGQTVPETTWRFNYGNVKFKAELNDIFDMPKEDDVNVPEEWMKQVEVAKHTPYKSQAYSGGYAGGYTGGTGSKAPSSQQQAGGSSQVGGGYSQYDYDEWEGWPSRYHNPNPGSAAKAGQVGKEDEFRFKGQQKGKAGGAEAKANVANNFSNNTAENGNRLGPQLLKGKTVTTPSGVIVPAVAKTDALQKNTEEVGENSMSDFWGLVSGVAKGQTSSELAQAIEQPDDFPRSLIEAHPRWLELDTNFGSQVADAFCLIDQVMSDLSGHDDLLNDLISDLFQLGSASNQLNVFRKMHSLLAPKDQEKLAQNGI